MAPSSRNITPCTGPSGKTCIQALAAGRINFTDLCPACIRKVMRALETYAVEPLEWHKSYLARARSGTG